MSCSAPTTTTPQVMAIHTQEVAKNEQQQVVAQDEVLNDSTITSLDIWGRRKPSAA